MLGAKNILQNYAPLLKSSLQSDLSTLCVPNHCQSTTGNDWAFTALHCTEVHGHLCCPPLPEDIASNARPTYLFTLHRRHSKYVLQSSTYPSSNSKKYVFPQHIQLKRIRLYMFHCIDHKQRVCDKCGSSCVHSSYQPR